MGNRNTFVEFMERAGRAFASIKFHYKAFASIKVHYKLVRQHVFKHIGSLERHKVLEKLKNQ